MNKDFKYKCGILGYPLKKPRSIKLWKDYFKKNYINSSMLKFEVKKKNVKNFFSFIKKNKNFLATAVTMPYKQEVIKYVSSLDSFAKRSGAINLIVKKKNKLLGYNTDVYGAINSIKDELRQFNNILIIGLGGTGSAIFNYMIKTFPKKNYFIKTSKNFFFKKKNIQTIKKIDEKLIKNKFLFINCTPLGSDLKKIFKNKTPINKEIFPKINKSSCIFDIVYSPKITILNKLSKKFNIKYLNGVRMNTMQAKKALKITFKK